MKPIQGFVMNFGYVESTQVSKVFIRHLYGGFNSLQSAVTSLSHYLLENVPWCGCVEDLAAYFYSIPSQVASGGIGDVTFDPEHTNGEEWWAWDPVHSIYHLLPYFYENDLYSMTDILIRYLRPNRIKNLKLKADLIDYKKERYIWKLNNVFFKCVNKNKSK